MDKEAHIICSGQIMALVERLRHVLTISDEGGLVEKSGLTIWKDDAGATIYWRWALDEQGIPFVQNYLNVRSNLRFNESGAIVEGEEHLLAICTLVDTLQWQSAVLAFLATHDEPPCDGRAQTRPH